jgi:hypothetical protein
MTHPFATPGHRRQCKRCRCDVIRVYTRVPSYNVEVDVTPINDPAATGPYFRRLNDDTFLQINSLTEVGGVSGVPAGATFAAHHCLPPARCRHCEHVHQTTGNTAGDNNPAQPNERNTA